MCARFVPVAVFDDLLQEPFSGKCKASISDVVASFFSPIERDRLTKRQHAFKVERGLAKSIKPASQSGSGSERKTKKSKSPIPGMSIEDFQSWLGEDWEDEVVKRRIQEHLQRDVTGPSTLLSDSGQCLDSSWLAS